MTGRSPLPTRLLPVALLLVSCPAVADDIRVRVPHRGADQAAIRALKLRLDLDLDQAGAPVHYDVIMHSGVPTDANRMLIQRLPAPDGDDHCIGGTWCDHAVDGGRLVNLSLGDQSSEGDRTRATIFVRPEERPDGCHSRMAADEHITVRVYGATVTGACLEVFDNALACNGQSLVVPGNPRANDTYPRLVDPQGILHTPTHTCAGWRPPLDVAVVLDISGSMSGRFQSGNPDSGTKLDVARELLEKFLQIWEGMRENETEPCDPAVFDPGRPCDADRNRSDAFALVPFDHDARPEMGTPGMQALTHVLGAGWPAFEAVLDALQPRGATSIGDGLIAALGRDYLDLPAVVEAELRGDDGPATRRRKVALVISDGKTNSPTHLRVWDNELQVSDDGDGWIPVGRGQAGVPAALEALRRGGAFAEAAWRATIYTVTVGGPGGVSARIMGNLARVTHGAYHHVERQHDVGAHEFEAIMLRALQNVLRFNTWRVVRELRGEVAGFTRTLDVLGVHPEDHRRGSTRFHVPQTAQAVAIVAMFDPSANADFDPEGQIGLQLRPPAGIDAPEPVMGRGLASITVKLPRAGRGHTAWGAWGLEVFQEGAEDPVPIKVTILADTLGVEATTTVVGEDVAVGDRVVVESRLGALGRPVHDLGPAGIWLSVKTPEHALGERMSDPAVRGPLQQAHRGLVGAPDAGNHMASLRDALATVDPNAFDRGWRRYAMLDDGLGVDRIAGDGVYTTAFVARRTGHHEVVTTAAGRRHPEVGDFDFQDARTIFVRDAPTPLTIFDPDRAEDEQPYVIEDDHQPDGSIVRTVRFTPRNAFGDRLGPGHEGALYMRDGDDRLLPMADPDLDGTYEVALTLAAGAAPEEPELVWSDEPDPTVGQDIAEVAVIDPEAAHDRPLVELDPGEAARIVRGVARACDCSATDFEPTSAALGIALLVLGAGRRRRRG